MQLPSSFPFPFTFAGRSRQVPACTVAFVAHKSYSGIHIGRESFVETVQEVRCLVERTDRNHGDTSRFSEPESLGSSPSLLFHASVAESVARLQPTLHRRSPELASSASSIAIAAIASFTSVHLLSSNLTRCSYG